LQLVQLHPKVIDQRGFTVTRNPAPWPSALSYSLECPPRVSDKETERMPSAVATDRFADLGKPAVIPEIKMLVDNLAIQGIATYGDSSRRVQILSR
jgi:hypothetical protein